MPDYCPVCKTEAVIQNSNPFIVLCNRCGDYYIERIAKAYLGSLLDTDIKVAILSHAIRKMQREENPPHLELSNINKILENNLPKPSEQIEGFILWLGDNTQVLGEEATINHNFLQAQLGLVKIDGIDMLLENLSRRNIIETTNPNTFGSPTICRLLPDGWDFYYKLKQGSSTSKKAFMAMQYGNPELDEIVNKYFRPAVKEAGFDMYRLDDIPKAGLIDDHLRIEIRTSRFLIADLTHENRGAYWEAGYAEGLGKPVIYTCEKSRFEQLNTHFDTNHHTTILWDRGNLDQASSNLKNTIRATLPDEAKLIDG